MNQGIDYMYDDGLSDEGFMRASKQLASIFSELGDPLATLYVDKEGGVIEDDSTVEGACRALDTLFEVCEKHGIDPSAGIVLGGVKGGHIEVVEGE